MEKIYQKHGDKIRFVLVGGANTALDFVLLFLFVNLGVNKIVANYFSTGLALIFSFFVNKSFTFKNKDKNAKKQFAIFLVVTLSGLWILQPIIIWASSPILEPYIPDSNILLFVAKLVASVATLVWNYLFYSRLVFKKAEQ
jgi:putative flippase GtrA